MVYQSFHFDTETETREMNWWERKDTQKKVTIVPTAGPQTHIKCVRVVKKNCEGDFTEKL